MNKTFLLADEETLDVQAVLLVKVDTDLEELKEKAKVIKTKIQNEAEEWHYSDVINALLEEDEVIAEVPFGVLYL
ncbi:MULTISPECIES: hypothetical protein [Bacillus cereus group]|uniref:Uncharacterized protein n=1 Tax=Bacillus thuringiensis TaxID=1428 RepID=A0A9X6VCJ4_BACTU|nr:MULTISPECIES: hypothetical protein [Bacillus cereus group]MEC3272761.1 hypothetical protein [Bacillus thuringiensis]PFB07873.1 hypothetical protein CN398_09045 [Bacillus thuringiensis]HDR7922336.1 hypothetical protein [Bacillus paranthracis]